MIIQHCFVLIVFSVLFLATPVNAQEKQVKDLSLPTWDTISDTDKDCTISPAIIMTVPGKNHDLHPHRGMSAPRLLKKVSGDFTVQVKVTGEFIPGEKSVGKGLAFNGAGLLIWQNKNNFLRMERNAFGDPDSLHCFPPLIEHWQDGKYKGVNSKVVLADDFFEGYSTWLKFQRKGTSITASYSHDGKEWTVTKKLTIDFSDELSVGVAALNTSNAPFIVVFEEFNLTTK